VKHAHAHPGGGPGLFLVSLLLLLSGAAALIYQVAWVRLLGQSVGADSEAVATVIAAFFFGLGMGSLGAERWMARRGAGLGLYAGLELAIALSSLGLFWVLHRLGALLVHAPALGSSAGMRFALAFALLAVPTICMGATFPILAALYVRRQEDMGRNIGHLYSVNTIGAVLGVLLGGFVLIPHIGLAGAVRVAVLLNLGAAAAAFAARGRGAILGSTQASEAGAAALAGGTDTAAVASAPRAVRGQALFVLALTGFVAIAAEVGWTRALAIFTGSTIFGFAAILAAFLIGIAGGSWFIRKRLARLGDPHRALLLGLVALGAALLATRAGFSTVPAIYRSLNAQGDGSGLRYAVVFALLLPSTFLFGALYPLSLQLYCGEVSEVRRRVGRATAVNTFASIGGSLAAGFWLIPAFGTDRLLLGLALAVLAAPALLALLPGSAPRASRRASVAIPALLLAAVGIFLPGIDFEELIRSVAYRQDLAADAEDEATFLYLSEGKHGVISAVTYDGRVATLSSNGLQEALIDTQEPRFGPVVEGLLGLLPYFFHAEPRSAFVVGFGGGTTVQTLAFTDLESIRVVELEPKIVDAVRLLCGGEIPCLQDPRVELDFGDARSVLALEDRTYDVIASQPSHPWLVGAGNLFTAEFFRVARGRLNPGGVFCQWVNLFRMDATTLRTCVATFFDAFPHGFVAWNAVTSDLLLVGSTAPISLDHGRVAGAIGEHADLREFLSRNGLRAPGHLLWYFYSSRAGALRLAGDAPVNTDSDLLTEVRLGALGSAMTPEEDPGLLLAKFYAFDAVSALAPEDAARTLLEAGWFFLGFQGLAQAQAIQVQLEGLGAEQSAAELRAAIDLKAAELGIGR